MISHTTEEISKAASICKSILGTRFENFSDFSIGMKIPNILRPSEEIELSNALNNHGFVLLIDNVVKSLRVLALEETCTQQRCAVSSDNDVLMLSELLGVPPNIEAISLEFVRVTGKELHDDRESSEYTNVAAQADIDFYEEEPI